MKITWTDRALKRQCVLPVVGEWKWSREAINEKCIFAEFLCVWSKRVRLTFGHAGFQFRCSKSIGRCKRGLSKHGPTRLEQLARDGCQFFIQSRCRKLWTPKKKSNQSKEIPHVKRVSNLTGDLEWPCAPFRARKLSCPNRSTKWKQWRIRRKTWKLMRKRNKPTTQDKLSKASFVTVPVGMGAGPVTKSTACPVPVPFHVLPTWRLVGFLHQTFAWHDLQPAVL